MLRALALLCLLPWFGLSAAGSIDHAHFPPGLDQAEVHTLGNGLRVVLNPRHHANTTAFRIVVGVGQRHFPCGAQETPHLLEHLMFAGTSRYSEVELDARIEGLGGSWNAETHPEYTVYQLDIYSPNALEGLGVLHEILTDSVFSPETVETSRDIVHREMGGRPGALTQRLYRWGFGKTGADRALEHLLPGSGLDCPGLETADGITREDLIAAYLRYYVPANMLVIAVGPFEPETMLAQIDATLGSIPAQPAPVPAFEEPRWPTAAARVTSRFTPLIDSEAIVEVAWRTGGRGHEDFPALVLLEDYLASAFFDELRTRRGLAYAPEAHYEAYTDFGFFSLYADVDLDQIETTIRVVDSLLAPLLSGPLPDDVVDKARASKLLQSAQAFETNRAMANYYVRTHREIFDHGIVPHHFAAVAEVTAEDLYRVARRYLGPERRVVITETPTLSYERLLWGGLLLAVLAGSLFWRSRRRRRLDNGLKGRP